MTEMTSTERRASSSLASIYALRMLGLFLVLPVFTLEAAKYPGGDNLALIGLAMGAYGLTQAALQIPFGMASDRLGRKRVIIFGLIVFALGSFIAGQATDLMELLLGRAIQGAGAVSAATTALLADMTTDKVRTKAMAAIGISIGAVFALSLVLAPVLSAHIGLAGIFSLTGVLAMIAIVALLWWTPPEPKRSLAPIAEDSFFSVLQTPNLARLHFGVWALHTVQMAMWVCLPALLVKAGLAKTAHWQMYLPIVLLSFISMGAVFFFERKGYLRGVFLAAIGLIALAQAALLLNAQGAGLVYLGAVLLIFFCGFNALEATQPSLVSKLAPPHARGAALGIYSTLQSLGLFAGGALGGLLAKWGESTAVFAATACLTVLWLGIAWHMPAGSSYDAIASKS